MTRSNKTKKNRIKPEFMYNFLLDCFFLECFFARLINLIFCLPIEINWSILRALLCCLSILETEKVLSARVTKAADEVELHGVKSKFEFWQFRITFNFSAPYQAGVDHLSCSLLQRNRNHRLEFESNFCSKFENRLFLRLFLRYRCYFFAVILAKLNTVSYSEF